MWPSSLYGDSEWEVEDQPDLVYIHNGIQRSGELQRRIPKASRRLLDTQLAQLQKHGIVIKKISNQKPLKVEYELTPLGQTLIPVIESTARWGETNRGILESLIQS